MDEARRPSGQRASTVSQVVQRNQYNNKKSGVRANSLLTVYPSCLVVQDFLETHSVEVAMLARDISYAGFRIIAFPGILTARAGIGAHGDDHRVQYRLEPIIDLSELAIAGGDITI